MPGRLWGCYSVADHLVPRAFIADLILYDRLLIPTPAPDDLARWDKMKWNPERQARMLDILGPFAERIEWSQPLRARWAEEWSQRDTATESDSAYGMTRGIISTQVQQDVQESGDVTALAVYAAPDRFDREWELVRSPKFLTAKQTMTPGEVWQAVGPVPPGGEELAKLVVTQLLVPDDGVDDEEALKRTVDLVTKPGVSEQRAQLHQAIAAIGAQDRILDQTVVLEVNQLLGALNESVRKNTRRQRARALITGLTWLAGGFALYVPVVGALTAPAAKLGETIVKRRYGPAPVTPDPTAGGIELLAEAQLALAEK